LIKNQVIDFKLGEMGFVLTKKILTGIILFLVLVILVSLQTK
jgi:hypothetical protein